MQHANPDPGNESLRSRDPVVGAAITFDHDNEDAKTPRTAANGFVTVRTEDLSDGNHVVRITPRYTSDLQVGPDIAEDLAVSVTRMFRSLEVGITVLKGKVQAVNSLPGKQSRGSVAAGTNPVRVLLQPMYHRSPHQNPNFRTREKITLIVVHQTAGSTNIGGTLTWFENQQANPNDNVSSNYVISAEANPQVVKVVQDTSRAWHAGGLVIAWEFSDVLPVSQLYANSVKYHSGDKQFVLFKGKTGSIEMWNFLVDCFG